jgi:hypothetical protein
LYTHEKVAANSEKVIHLCQNLFRTADYPVLYQSLSESKAMTTGAA